MAKMSNLDALHAEALHAHALWEIEQAAAEQATPRYRHFTEAVRQGGDYRRGLDILHAEALTEDDAIAYAAYVDGLSEDERDADYRAELANERAIEWRNHWATL